MKKESAIINRIYSVISLISSKTERLKGRYPEITVLLLYIVLHIVITCFHEPWYDEAEAWNIAASGELKEILFEVPSYEGHPALWHIILMPFAYFGLNYELSLNIVTLLFSGITVTLILFKSPLPRIVNIFIPFTYFIFYQYGVIARPYCVTLLAFILLAITYSKRNTKPLFYTASLALLCATSAYGVVISGGLAAVWLVEFVWNIIKNRIEKKSVSQVLLSILRDKTTLSLLVLLIYAIFIIVRIIPENEGGIASHTADQVNTLLERLIYTFFAMIPDVLITNTYNTYDYLNKVQFDTVSFIATSLLGIAIISGIIYIGKKKKTLWTFLVPYILFAAFSAGIYLCIHHIGILFGLLLFWIWISFGNNEKVQVTPILMKVIAIFSTVAILMSFWWNVMSCVTEINGNYSPDARIAEYIRDNDLNSCNILFQNSNSDSDDYKHSAREVAFLPYRTNENILNWPVEKPLFPAYLKSDSEEFMQELKNAIKNGAIPDVIIDYPDLGAIYGSKVSASDYETVLKITSKYIWKGSGMDTFTYISLRKVTTILIKERYTKLLEKF